ncbi:transglutaminase domain-containing protein [Paenibacillus lignilyticus]|uniref:Transglutaminase domain-containing protein n=1 Tax=Paenibacillus lignilyticus TaxID=1172615 RepID=A0ABS5C5H2_9BACL|nr:transglutaminase domain-containing protein [Paenibacillus lignilyticus]MBP3961237.1 transglutaminase domain-containing protein [Paenibacillus lignilyticus]
MSLTAAGCSLDEETRITIERKFKEKEQLASARKTELFSVFEEELSEEERLALKFLYAYMPLNDLADYEGSLFLSHVRKTLEIRREMPWGNRVPDHLFLHFVLPYRVNNENIEDSRGILFDELYSRVKLLSMGDAILETNHWCYEKATYIGNDPRTVSPLTLIRTTLGRCGEESTLAVAALRSLCIPARQCYTPRWAHSDSNHAWVEAWADGSWHFIGACEPEPRLNEGWFSGPARRAMLINTRVPSQYPGPESITLAHEWYTEINLLDGYAPCRNIVVRIRDSEGQPVSGAAVSFQVYNFAEFTPIAKLTTDARGEVTLTTGFGDLLVRAVEGSRWGESKLSVSEQDAFTITIDEYEQQDGITEFDMVPPPELPADEASAVTDEVLQQHRSRMQQGAAIRKRFADTFVSESRAGEIALDLDLPAERVWQVLRKARGNSHEIAAFLQEQTETYGEWPLRLLESLNEKDLTDTFRPALFDHLKGSLPYADLYDVELFSRYVLCPRVLFEMIGPYKQFFQETLLAADIADYRLAPSGLVSHLLEKFEVVEDMTYYQGSAMPAGSYRLLKGDRISRDILFVALCRSIGIPARLHPSERKPQYWMNAVWHDACFEQVSKLTPAAGIGRVLLKRNPGAPAEAEEAAYFRNFSFARLENGWYQSLFYPHGQTNVYDQPFELEAGSYRMTAGTRLKDGSVLVRFTYFTVPDGMHGELPLSFRYPVTEVPVIGEVDSAWRFTRRDGTHASMDELTRGRNAVLAWIEPEREPSKHLLREIKELASGYDALGMPIILAVPEEGWTASFDPAAYEGFLADVTFVRDRDLVIQQAAGKLPGTDTGALPFVLVVDSEGRIRYTTAGYKLGIGREVLQTGIRLSQQK